MERILETFIGRASGDLFDPESPDSRRREVAHAWISGRLRSVSNAVGQLHRL